MEEFIQNRGCVYFFRHIGLSPVKIGMSSNDSPAKRFEQFSTYAPYGSEIIGFIITSDYVALEKQLHRKYENKRLSCEWFDITEEDCLKEIDFYSNIEDVKERNEFQKAWAKMVSVTRMRVDTDISTTMSEMNRKTEFKKLFLAGKINIKRTAMDFGVSRQTAYKWINSFNKSV